MGYKVKWVEDHIGVSRKALRGFEKEGLMPENINKQHREYEDDDIDRIWAIRVMQGMGYTVKEIAKIAKDETFDFESSLGIKINELEEKKKKVERHIGYAKTIKLTGRFPARPKKMGEIKFEEFQEKALEGWNIIDDPQATEYQKVVETLLSKEPDEWDNSELGRILMTFEKLANLDTDLIAAEYVLPKEIIKRKALGASHPEVQLIVKMIYDNQKALLQLVEFDATQFARFYSSSYFSGDVAKFKIGDFSEEEREFIANAVAIFGGFENYNDLIETELKYGR